MTDADVILLIVVMVVVPCGVGLGLCFAHMPKSTAAILKENEDG